MSLQKLGYDGASPKERGHINYGSVSSGAKSAIYDVSGIDSMSVQVTSGGTLAATITVLASNSFIPASGQDLSDSTSTANRAGSFVDITSRVTGITNPTGSGGDCMIEINAAGLIGFAFVKVTFTRTGGSGQLDFYASGKAVSR